MKSFAQVYMNLVPQWSPDNCLGPEQVSFGSNKPIIWNGTCGHTWIATPKNRGHGHGCPICSGNLIQAGTNDFASRYPKIAREWAKRNDPARPSEFAPQSNKSFWWKCGICGQEWNARIADRVEGHGCPFCVKNAIEERKQQRIRNKHLETAQKSRNREIKRQIRDDIFCWRTVAYYARINGLSVEYNSEQLIGIPLQFFFPEKCAAIELTSYMNEGWQNWRRENAKNWLCLNSDIKLIRIIPQKMKKYENCKCVRLKARTVDSLNYTVRQVFKRLKVIADVDVERDFEGIQEMKM